jgi:hypothetical protein
MKHLLQFSIFIVFTLSLQSSFWEVFTPENSALESDVISEILVDNNNVTWIATGSGLAKFENDELILLNNSNSILPTQNVTDLFIDNNNLLWVLFGDKIYRGINSGFELYRNDIGGSEIAVDSKNNVYLANGFDIFRLSDKMDLDTIYYPSRTNPRHISSMIIDEQDNLWFTKSANYGEYWIYSSGIILKSDSLDNGYEIIDFISFKTDKLSNIWLVGTRGKLLKYDIEKELWYDMTDEYSLDFEGNISINNLAFDKEGRLVF